ncbi:mechanosensitive ion channel protein MscS [Halobacteriales archaeon SW_6_65_15]|jgi:small-conductance mechanosensitive channel|nr:MAG: mechanosensitive ion channel protein MscS [Halobacteriales archaeon SW_6_65_15]
MMISQAGLFDGLVEESVAELRATAVDLIPKLVTALLFLAVAYVAIRLVLAVVRSALERIYADSQLVADLFTTVAAVFLWFAAALTLLKILGMGDIAASLGTATGFVALGVSYALSDMIADIVAGVYLLRDPDFDPGDEVVVGDVTGVVREVDLRKTRLEVEGDVVVMGNSSVEEKWTKKGAPERELPETEADPEATERTDDPSG